MAGTTDKDWFYLSHGHRKGPVSRDEIKELLLEKELFIESTQVWSEGMDDWVGIAESKHFSATVKQVLEAEAKAEEEVRHAATIKKDGDDETCRGASRGLFNMFFYVGWIFPLMIGVVLLSELQVHQFFTKEYVDNTWWCQVLPIFLVGLYLWQLAVSRMKHAGFKGWQGITLFIPIWNIWTLFVCLLTPQNFKRKKKLDLPALGYFVLFLVMVGIPFSGIIPSINRESMQPFAVKDSVTAFYNYHTNFKTRMRHNDEQARELDKKRGKVPAAEEEEDVDLPSELLETDQPTSNTGDTGE